MEPQMVLVCWGRGGVLGKTFFSKNNFNQGCRDSSVGEVRVLRRHEDLSFIPRPQVEKLNTMVVIVIPAQEGGGKIPWVLLASHPIHSTKLQANENPSLKITRWLAPENTHAWCTHARTHARTHAHTHIRTHTCTYMQRPIKKYIFVILCCSVHAVPEEARRGHQVPLELEIHVTVSLLTGC